MVFSHGAINTVAASRSRSPTISACWVPARVRAWASWRCRKRAGLLDHAGQGQSTQCEALTQSGSLRILAPQPADHRAINERSSPCLDLSGAVASRRHSNVVSSPTASADRAAPLSDNYRPSRACRRSSFEMALASARSSGCARRVWTQTWVRPRTGVGLTMPAIACRGARLVFRAAPARQARTRPEPSRRISLAT